MNNIIVLASGEGTNLQAIIDACNNNSLNAKVSHVISDKKNAGALLKTPNGIFIDPKNLSRETYDKQVSDYINTLPHDLIVLAGWMRILSTALLNNITKPIINLHPALPGQYPGKNSIEDAYAAFTKGLTKKTGVMVHYVIEKLDAGDVIEQLEIPINDNDTLDSLKSKIRYYEKFVLIRAIDKVLNASVIGNYKFLYTGKVREVYDIGFDLIAMVHSDRQSAFDRFICDIPNKGIILTQLSEWWFNQTSQITPNHFIYSMGNVMICKKCKPFKVEVVVRGYITGTTATSLWTHYNKGVRDYCGIVFPDGLVKNQKLEFNVVTPTTKGDKDELITPAEIISTGLMTESEWNYVKTKALTLFEYGQFIADKKNLILVDTKYEFGRDVNGNILLIDELHTCDSSRYWVKSTYADRFNNKMEPEKLDKDVIREFVSSKCNPYEDALPEIPRDLISRVSNVYSQFYKTLTDKPIIYNVMKTNDAIEHYFNDIHEHIAVIMAGSVKDIDWINNIKKELVKLNIYSKTHISSAHKNTQDVLNIINDYNQYHGMRKIVFVAVAGLSNALGGILGANSKYPVINCPPLGNDLQMNVWSSLMCPTYTPVATILSPTNCALHVAKILNL